MLISIFNTHIQHYKNTILKYTRKKKFYDTTHEYRITISVRRTLDLPFHLRIATYLTLVVTTTA